MAGFFSLLLYLAFRGLSVDERKLSEVQLMP
jgi:hypothetical protein